MNAVSFDQRAHTNPQQAQSFVQRHTLELDQAHQLQVVQKGLDLLRAQTRDAGQPASYRIKGRPVTGVLATAMS